MRPVKRVLVTGAGGFVGRHCLPLLLARGFEVHGLSTSTGPKPYAEQVHWHKVDLLDESRIRQIINVVSPTHLLHLAWYTEHGKYWASPLNLDWVKASLALLKAFRECGGERVLMAGSCAEYDWQAGYCTEEFTALAPQTLYGSAKQALYLLARGYAGQCGLSFAWGRIFFTFGPYEPSTRLIPGLVLSLMQDRPARCTHGRQMRDFIYVEDAANALTTLLDSAVEGPLNIGSGVPVAVRDVVLEVAHQLKKPHLLELGAIPLSREEPDLLLANTRRLKSELEWAPQYTLSAALGESIEFWKQASRSEVLQ